jgi:hypothetical protein
MRSILGAVGRLVADIVREPRIPRDKTDVDFRRLPEQKGDVIAGYESKPRVPGSTQDEVR